MNLTQRETVLFTATASVALIGISLVLARPRIDEFRNLGARQRVVREQIADDQALVAEAGKWQAGLDELRNMLPVVPPDKKMDVYWLSVMDRLAAARGLKISRRQAGEEQREGDIYELPIQCDDWEGDLESLLHFLFDLQSEGAMMDVRELHIRPKGKSLLRGRFALYCAYAKSSNAEPPPNEE